MKRRNLSLVFVCMALALYLFAGCESAIGGGSGSSSSKKNSGVSSAPGTRDSSLVGKWVKTSDSNEYYEFFSNGDYIIASSGVFLQASKLGGLDINYWCTDGTTLYLKPGQNTTYSVSGNSLTAFSLNFTKQ